MGLENLIWLRVQRVSCDESLQRMIGSSKGPRSVSEETSVFRAWSCQRILAT